MSFRHKNGLPEDVRNDVWRAYHSVSYFSFFSKMKDSNNITSATAFLFLDALLKRFARIIFTIICQLLVKDFHGFYWL